ncbi:MAG: metalloregulator ArsR/SmtB family transcription factor [Pseudomonadota bacterium]
MLDATLNLFRAIGEETRLRIMLLLVRGELTVSEITQILGQSQPRVSRHLKILADAGLVERYREGSWMFYRASAPSAESEDALRAILNNLNASQDRVISRDRDRFAQSRKARADVAAAYFEKNAAEWDRVRRLHLPEADIESRLREVVGGERVETFVDLGAGTGRMLELFADLYETGLGIDLSREMLSIARANLEEAGVRHAQVRHGDLFAPPIDQGTADLVCIHQVLHFLAEPGAAVLEAAKLLKPGGRMIISDFAPHEMEFLREEHAHRRLGFSDNEVNGWCAAGSLTPVDVRTLSPGDRNGGKITVKIWVYAASASIRQLNARKSVERAS